jgi:uncharacterized protein YqjF (DUF2071 family)
MTAIAITPTDEARLAARSPNGRRPLIMHQRWESLLFLHWRISADAIQQTLPPGLTVDTFDGSAYLGINPYFLRNVRPVGLPALPRFSHFEELSVRTYVFDETGTPGVWFYSLNCNRPLAVVAARMVGSLPYHAAEIRALRGEWIGYGCRRRGTTEIAHYKYRGAGPNHDPDIDSLEFFLLERYYLFAYRKSSQTLMRGQINHPPYRYRDAELPELSGIPAQLDGFTTLDDSPDHVCVVDGFDVKIFAQEKVSRAGLE